jgi:hypothetical protein
MLDEASRKMLEEGCRKMLTKKCWNIYKMLTNYVGYTLKNVDKKKLTSLEKC